jgi:hypothetical protein
MSVLRDYEKTVVNLLASRVLSPEQLDAVIREAALVEYDYTGCGYFLTIKHSNLPTTRMVCDTPKLTGSADGIVSGFVISLKEDCSQSNAIHGEMWMFPNGLETEMFNSLQPDKSNQRTRWWVLSW